MPIRRARPSGTRESGKHPYCSAIIWIRLINRNLTIRREHSGPATAMSCVGSEFMNRMQIVVLGVSVAAFGGAYILFNSGGPTPPIVQAAPKIETDEVLVAAQDVPM